MDTIYRKQVEARIKGGVVVVSERRSCKTRWMTLCSGLVCVAVKGDQITEA